MPFDLNGVVQLKSAVEQLNLVYGFDFVPFYNGTKAIKENY